MRLFLVRHAEASLDAPDGLGDEGRSLTLQARLHVGQHFAGLRGRIEPIDRIYFSPLVRCVQTAQILADALHFTGPLEAHCALRPDMDIGHVDGLLEQNQGLNVLLVGHNPSIGARAAYAMKKPRWPMGVPPATVIGLEAPHYSNEAAFSYLFSASPGQPVHTMFG